MTRKSLWTVMALCVLISTSALGQSLPRTPQTGVAEGQTATQNLPFKTVQFGDWVMTCRKANSSPQSQQNCEIVQTIVLNDQKSPFAQIAIGRIGTNAPLQVTVLVPHNVMFPSSVKITTDEKDKSPVDAAWTRCMQAGCFAVAIIKDDIRMKWVALNSQGRVAFKASNGQDIIMPISFKGVGNAIDQLSKEK